MIRDLNLQDTKRYKGDDLARLYCNDCKGCSKCCRDMEDTIVLDPLDVHKIRCITSMSFEELIEREIIELKFKEYLLYPNIKMREGMCPFLVNERCSIHSERPGVCRLFPLGRIYEEDTFSYFIQEGECTYKNRAKVKINNWLGYNNIKEYDSYILKWHEIRLRISKKVYGDLCEGKDCNTYLMGFLRDFYSRRFESFFTEFDALAKVYLEVQDGGKA